MTTEQLEAAEPTGDQANGSSTPAEAEPVVLEEPSEKETVPRLGDPRDAVVSIVRDRLERMLQPVDDDPVWHGVNVITAKDLDAATAEQLPPASIFAASVRTPAIEVSQRPPGGRVRPMPPSPARPFLDVVGAMQVELGIRPSPTIEFDDFGPGSSLSEELLFHAYRGVGEGEP